MLKEQFLGIFLGFFYKVYSSTLRFEILFEQLEDKKIFFEDLMALNPRKNKNLLYAAFHQDEMCMIPYFKNKNFLVLVSQSKDGQILASALEHLGYQTVRGSSHRGGVNAFMNGFKKVLQGYKFSIAVDGPRGPLYEVKEGIIVMSEKSKRPIVPLKAYPQSAHIFKKSWSKSALPLPFSKIKILVGKIGFYDQKGLEEKMKSLKVS